MAGVEQLKNQSYLWELRGRSTLEAIKGCSSWGLIARTAYQGESRGPRGRGLVNAKPAGHGWGSRKIGRQRSLRPCKCVLCSGASRLAKTQRFRCAQISLDGMRSLTSHGCGGAPRPCLNVQCLNVSTASLELGRWSRLDKQHQGCQSLFGARSCLCSRSIERQPHTVLIC